MAKLRSFWVTGASSGLGLAMARRLLEEGCRVAVSAKDCPELDRLSALHRKSLLHLPGSLQDITQAQEAGKMLHAQWGQLDGLIINAGTCEFVSGTPTASALFEAITRTNFDASQHCLDCALPLLSRGDKPQVQAIVSRYSALQLHEPTQPPSGQNSLPQWFREQRPRLQALGIELTLVAPQSLKTPVTSGQAIPEPWTSEKAAFELVQQLGKRKPELVLEVLDPQALWPLS